MTTTRRIPAYTPHPLARHVRDNNVVCHVSLQVLFQNDSVAAMLARIVGIVGPFPQDMLERGRHAHKCAK